MFPICEQVYIIEYYLFSDFRNYDNVLKAKIISILPHLVKALNVDAVFSLGALSPSNKQCWTEYAVMD